MENVIRPDTIGKVEEVAAKYELMPRGHYTYVRPSRDAASQSRAKKMSMDQYEAVLALYQALNAIQIARAAEIAGRMRATHNCGHRMHLQDARSPSRRATAPAGAGYE